MIRSFTSVGAAVLLAVALIGLGSSARADLYTDQPSFLAHVAPGYYLETFNSLPSYSDLGPSLAFSGGGFSYTASAPGDLFSVTPTGGTTALFTNFATSPLTFSFTSSNVTAVGGFIFPTDNPGDAVAGAITATLNDGSTISYASANLSSFAGFTSLIPILSLTLTTSDPSLFPTVDNLIVGTAVPEPSSLVVAAVVGAVGLVIHSKRRRLPVA